MNMNWIRILIRFAMSFIVLYLLGYMVPGFSGLTMPFLILIGVIIAFVSALVEMTTHPDSSRSRALIVFLISFAVIYLFTLAVAGRPPVVSTILAALLVAVIDLIYPERRGAGERKNVEGNGH